MEQKIRFSNLSTPLKTALILGGIAIIYLLWMFYENRMIISELVDLAGRHTDLLEQIVGGM
ncbi:MAG: hypothetical protein V1914_00655 [archaeon]